jgi:16S rRNA (uracil1498-N3)-methyltransferase
MAGHPEAPGGSAPHVIVDDVATPALSVDDRHHLSRVRRIRPGDPLSVTDGNGSWRWCRFGDEIEPESEVVLDAVPFPRLCVAFALVKGERPELVVQKLTELGIDLIVPFVADRSVVRWDGSKAEKNHERLVKVAREASAQSRRVWLPTVTTVCGFDSLSGHGEFVRADRGGFFSGPANGMAPTAIAIGPEGGWSEREIHAMPDSVGLGPNVLRAETASIAAATLLAALRSGIVAIAEVRS